ncbi:protein of unknown function [Taphrina deformans PYCC 5710]|uniref:glucan endo-1,3-beta-D-glucosidase n=1 Tax=Taphrina deformans (strain PYCC 5710 / ATCC 11124 / CBS 356.35 / IMI 108563 / JCM 9778 / NBRC 8474) TaxID=1097556 RepID=R4XKE2_TAPDE|nr:protein of unknown function [Taphrina deformans PYCC 5710]|eukprot:CCG84929.1 protein of unknown function [Taphrina deformans PYCC 5710]
MQFSNILSLAATVSVAAAQYKGFNYGSTHTDGSAKTQADFEAEFAAAKSLTGATGFTSARLYTTIQAGTDNTPILAIPAAIAQDTSILLGLWASGGQAGFTNEINAITNAIAQYGTAFTNRVIGISVGSEDLYRVSTIGIASMAGVGVGPDIIVQYINQLKTALASTTLRSAKITHVDTYNAWTNGSNSAVISAVDFLSMDVYPYFQSEMANSIEQGSSLFNTAYDETVAVAAGKDVWVTETGWPVSGPNQGAAVASVANSKIYWDQVGCNTLFGKVNTFWYILQDALPTLPSPSFGLVGAGSISQAPLFNLTCPAAGSSSTAASSAAVSSAAAPSGAALAAGAVSAARVASSSSVSAVAAVPASTATAAVRPGYVPSSRASSARSSAPVTGSTSTSAARVTSATGTRATTASTTSTRATTASTTSTRATTASTAGSTTAPISTSDSSSNTVSYLAALVGGFALLMTC